ncbi:hypothetical protein [Vibrio sp. TBV020]|uniref:hypothetical protein n=1 Tax=Vibrio sp. TBV020 TaxID=3137398 RepID=UPI0038CD5D2B
MNITLILIGWVFAICLSQNAGWQSVCEFKYSSLVDYSVDVSQPKELNKQCDLTEKLLSSAKASLEHVIITVFVIALVIVVWRILTPSVAPAFTEPIPPNNRLHLTFCVFRE